MGIRLDETPPILRAGTGNNRNTQHGEDLRSCSLATLAVAAGPDVGIWRSGDPPPANASGGSASGATTTAHKLILHLGADDRHSGRGQVRGVAWNHNGQVLAVATTTDKASAVASPPSVADPDLSSAVDLVEAQTGRTLETLPLGGPVAAGSLGPTAFGGKSRYLCVTAPTHAALWDLKKRRQVRRFGDATTGTLLLQARADPTDTVLGTLSPKRVMAYDLRHGHEVGRLPSPGATCDWTCWDWSAATSSVGVAPCALGATDGRVRLFDCSGWVHPPPSPAPPTQLVQLYHSGSSILQVALRSTSASGTAMVGGTAATAPLKLLCALSQDCLAVYAWEGGICLYAKPLDVLDRTTCLSWNGELVAFGNALGDVSILEWRRDRVLATLNFSSPIHHLAFGPAIAPTVVEAVRSTMTATASSEWDLSPALALPAAIASFRTEESPHRSPLGAPSSSSPLPSGQVVLNSAAQGATSSYSSSSVAVAATAEDPDRLQTRLLGQRGALGEQQVDAVRQFRQHTERVRGQHSRVEEGEDERADDARDRRSLLDAVSELRGELAQQGELLRGIARDQRALRHEVEELRRDLLPQRGGRPTA